MKKIILFIITFNWCYTLSAQETVIDTLRLRYSPGAISSKQVGMTVSNDGRLIAFAFEDRSISIFDVNDNKLINILESHYEQLFDIRFNYDATKLITVDKNSQISVVEINTGQIISTRIEEGISKVVPSDIDNSLLIGTYNARKKEIPKVYLFDQENIRQPLHVFQMKGAIVAGIAFGKEPNQALAITNPWNLLKKAEVSTLNLITYHKSIHDLRLPPNIHSINYSRQDDVFTIGCNNLKSNYLIDVTIDGKILSIKNTTKVPVTFKIKEESNFTITLSNFYRFKENLLFINYDNSFSIIEETIPKYCFKFTTLCAREETLDDIACTTLPIKAKKIYPFYDGKHFIVNYDEQASNVTQIFNAEKLEFIGYFFCKSSNEILTASRNRQVDSDKETTSQLYWTNHKTKMRTSVEESFNENYTKGLLKEILKE